MKWYSEEELKKWCGHCITLPLLEQMKYKEMRYCEECDYWTPPHSNNEFNKGICRIFKEFTDADRPCIVRSK